MSILSLRGDIFNSKQQKSQKKGPWAAHIGFGTWNGREITTEIFPDKIGTEYAQSFDETRQLMNATISEFYPKTNDKNDPNLRSFSPSRISVSC